AKLRFTSHRGPEGAGAQRTVEPQRQAAAVQGPRRNGGLVFPEAGGGPHWNALVPLERALEPNADAEPLAQGEPGAGGPHTEWLGVVAPELLRGDAVPQERDFGHVSGVAIRALREDAGPDAGRTFDRERRSPLRL